MNEMTWEEVRALPKDRAVAVLPMGAIEAHGPHLPLGTDVLVAEAMAAKGAERLAERTYTVLVMPALAYAPAPFAQSFAGTISLRPATATAVLTDIAESLSRNGVPLLALANAHFDPAQLSAIRDAITEVRARSDVEIVFPDLTRRALAERLTAEFRSGACHAGQYETSIVLAERPDLVRHHLRAELPAVEISLSDAIRAGVGTFVEAGGDRAYFGAPAAATPSEGARTIDILGTILEEAVVAGFPHAA